MSLQSIYEAFLASPKADALAQDAVLSYITSLTSFSDSAPIIKHLETQRKAIRKKTEKTLNAISDRHGLFLEVETALEFVTGGGAYLPGLDDNFLIDQTVILPIQHVVHFNSSGKIKQIRLYWDQGSLLKSVEVIGSRAKAWPIRDGKDQIRLIVTSVNAGEIHSSSETTSRRQSSARPTKDPHGTLEPFAANIPEETETQSSFDGPVVKPRASARPAQREWDELFVNETDNHERSVSPSKADVVAPKIGAGKNFKENRLFGEAQSPSNEIQNKFRSPNPQKFEHFDFHDGHQEDAPKPGAPKPRTKHQSQWDFSDFTTPLKQPSRRQDHRSFAFDEETLDESPIKKSHVTQPRRDADTHFNIEDEDQPENRKAGHLRGKQSNSIKDKTLFSNNVISEEGAVDINARGRPMSTLANTKDRQKDFGNHWEASDNPTHGDKTSIEIGANLKDRHKDFDPHFKISDSPGATESKEQKRPSGENQNKAIKMMQPSWNVSETGPDNGGKENRLMGIFGNGMGGRKGVQRGWSIGDDGS